MFREKKNTYKLPTGEPLRKALVKLFRAQRTAILRYVRTGKKAAGGGIPESIPSMDEFGLGAKAFAKDVTPIITATWDKAGTQLAARVGMDPEDWSVTNPKVQEAIDNAVLAFSESTNDTTSMELDDALQAVRESLGEGISAGEGLDDLTERISEIFDQAETSRARSIAATETSRAVHEGQMAAAEESDGLVTGWEWLASEDACEKICQVIVEEAPFVELGTPFAIVGEGEYSTVYSPPAHVNCQCSMNEVLVTDDQPEWSDTITIDLSKGKDKDKDKPGGKKCLARAQSRSKLPVRAKAMAPRPAMKPRPAVKVFLKSSRTSGKKLSTHT